jgi:hypothetical protein
MAILENNAQFLDYWYKLRSAEKAEVNAALTVLGGSTIDQVIKKTRAELKQKLAWEPWMDALLGTNTDVEVGKLVNKSACAVRSRRASLGVLAFTIAPTEWESWMDALLGTKTDAEVGKLVNKSKPTVQLRRVSLGVPVFKSTQIAWDPWMDALLGTKTDVEVGKLTGKASSTVTNRRALLGVPCFSSNKPRATIAK